MFSFPSPRDLKLFFFFKGQKRVHGPAKTNDTNIRIVKNRKIRNNFVINQFFVGGIEGQHLRRGAKL